MVNHQYLPVSFSRRMVLQLISVSSNTKPWAHIVFVILFYVWSKAACKSISQKIKNQATFELPLITKTSMSRFNHCMTRIKSNWLGQAKSRSCRYWCRKVDAVGICCLDFRSATSGSCPCCVLAALWCLPGRACSRKCVCNRDMDYTHQLNHKVFLLALNKYAWSTWPEISTTITKLPIAEVMQG